MPKRIASAPSVQQNIQQVSSSPSREEKNVGHVLLFLKFYVISKYLTKKTTPTNSDARERRRQRLRLSQNESSK
jgi:hypothetical protein